MAQKSAGANKKTTKKTLDKKKPEATIRQMEVDDIAPVYHLGSSLFTSEEFPILYRTWDPYEVTGYFSSDPDFCLVAEVDGKVVGFVLATTVEKEGTAWKKYGYISWMGVEQSFQRTSLARRLFRVVERRLKENKVRMIIADTEGDNEMAVGFFRSQGFSPRVEHVWLVKTLGRSVMKTGKGERPRSTAGRSGKQSSLPL